MWRLALCFIGLVHGYAGGIRTVTVDETLSSQMERRSNELGGVAQNLLNVQADINRVQKEVMGKVFDLSSVREFFVQYQETQAQVEQLKKEKEDLQQQIARMNGENANLMHEVQVLSGQRQQDASQATLTVEQAKADCEAGNAHLNQQVMSLTAAAQHDKMTVTECLQQNELLRKSVEEQSSYAKECHEKVSLVSMKLKDSMENQITTRDMQTIESMYNTCKDQLETCQDGLQKSSKEASSAVVTSQKIRAFTAQEMERCTAEENRLRVHSSELTAANMHYDTQLKQNAVRMQEFNDKIRGYVKYFQQYSYQQVYEQSKLCASDLKTKEAQLQECIAPTVKAPGSPLLAGGPAGVAAPAPVAPVPAAAAPMVVPAVPVA